MNATVADVLRGDARWCVVEGDSADVLRALPDDSVGAVITDPPYNERTHAGAKASRGKLSAETTVNFSSLVSTDWYSRALVVARRWCLAFCALEQLADYERAVGACWIRSGIWIRVGAAPQFTGDRPAPGCDAVAIAHRKGRKRWNGGGRHALWSHGFGADEVGNLRRHPTQKPVRLMLDLVRDFTDAGEVILDPFGGSGTTGVAALAEGRRVIIVERDPAYAAIARARCEAADTGRDWRRPEQASLFGGTP